MKIHHLIALTILLLLVIAGCSDSANNKQSRNAEYTSKAREVNENNSNIQNKEQQQPTLIVAMGDSLTEGLRVTSSNAYPAQLELLLQTNGQHVNVINAGISGETTSAALSRVNWIINLKPAIVILQTGANDAFRGIDLSLTKGNIDKIIAAFKAKGIIVILAGMQINQNLGKEYVENFTQIYPALATKHNITLIPSFLKNVGAVRELNQSDGIHPNAMGYSIIADTVYPYIIESIKR